MNPPEAAADGCNVAEFLVGDFLGFVRRVAGELEVAGGEGEVVGELVGDVGVEVLVWRRRQGGLGSRWIRFEWRIRKGRIGHVCIQVGMKNRRDAEARRYNAKCKLQIAN